MKPTCGLLAVPPGVRCNAYDLGAHWLDLRGKLLQMLQKAKPAELAGLVSCESSLKLVAGVGFEPTTFRL